MESGRILPKNMDPKKMLENLPNFEIQIIDTSYGGKIYRYTKVDTNTPENTTESNLRKY